MNKKSKIVVTSGEQFTDIDALACVIAYDELLKLEGYDSEAVLPGVLNESITVTVKKWGLVFTEQPNFKDAKFVLMDISEEKEFAHFVGHKNILELYDHRYGYEDYWKENLGKNSHVEMVGSCATLIWEEYEKRMSPLKISEVSARLLLTAIISNTLNFKASVTTNRDIKAFESLKKLSNLPKNWAEKYFEEQDLNKSKDIYSAIINDTKNLNGPVIGQLEMWNSKALFEKQLTELERAMASFGKEEWFLTSPSISEGVNYIYTKNTELKELLKKILDTEFNGDIGTTKKLWLRKEIIKKIQEMS